MTNDPPRDTLELAARFQNRLTGIVIGALVIAVIALALLALGALGFAVTFGQDNEDLRDESECRSLAAVEFDEAVGESLVLVMQGLGAVGSNDPDALAELAPQLFPAADALAEATRTRTASPGICSPAPRG